VVPVDDVYMNASEIIASVFNIQSEEQLNRIALEVYEYQYSHNSVYRAFCQALGRTGRAPVHYTQIPFMPVEFFKTHQVISSSTPAELVFTSSGTTGMQTSRHYIHDPAVYIESFTRCFRLFFGDPSEYHILALLPGYLERTGSSLIYMVDELIRQSKSSYSGFYLDELQSLQSMLSSLHDRKILLLGVSFALLDMAEKFPVHNPGLMIMETGGMKGRRKELIREELHQVLTSAFNVNTIYSEYGMTELLSQAYSTGYGIYATPPWMRVLVRETNDPITLSNTSGGINVIDLANIYSCSFIATQDLGRLLPGNRFEITGRFDNSDIRGCNLMVT
jgi:phenylacetate-coenzyme A ligase PaaK-like adenylate-forming protein